MLKISWLSFLLGDRPGRTTARFGICGSKTILLRSLLIVLSLFVCKAEIEDFDLLLPATSATIHFTDFYLRGPASIDFSGLDFIAVTSSQSDNYDDDDDGEHESLDTDDKIDADDDKNDKSGQPDSGSTGDSNNSKENQDNGVMTTGSGDDETAGKEAGTNNQGSVPGKSTGTTEDDDDQTKTEIENDDVVPRNQASVNGNGVAAKDGGSSANPGANSGQSASAGNGGTVAVTPGGATAAGNSGTGNSAGGANTGSTGSGQGSSHQGSGGPGNNAGGASGDTAHPATGGGGTDTNNGARGGGNRAVFRHLKEKKSLDLDKEATFLDVIAFALPSNCSKTQAGCDWTNLGVGAKKSDGTLRWCCSNDAIALGLCTGVEHYGRLIVDAEKFHGGHYSVRIANDGDVLTHVQGKTLKNLATGKYVVVMANCNDEGREILVNGKAAWKSVHGYLPGELFGFMYFYAAVTIVYMVLLFWYGCCMCCNEKSRIPIEKWILMTIIIGLLEMLFRSGDAFVWNEEGYRTEWITYSAIGIGVLKGGVSRCLIVMVSLGWGVTRESLGRKIKWIIILGLAYVGVSLFRDITILIAVEDMQELSTNIEQDLYDIYTILTLVLAAIDVLYVMWILDALSSTMEHLENMHQIRKLKRYLRLRCVFLYSVFFAAVWAIFAIVNSFDQTEIVQEENAWIVEASTELNYLFVLIGVAFLWRPNPNAKEYALHMELGVVENENETEMTGSVPSAVDDDEEEDAGRSTSHSNNNLNGKSFKRSQSDRSY